MDILKEEFPELNNTYELDAYVSTVLNLHPEFRLPEFIDTYSELADTVEKDHPDLAAFLRKAEILWQELEAK